MEFQEKEGLYNTIILELFKRHYSDGLQSFDFNRSEILEIANQLNIEPPKNIGDLIYSYRFRRRLPQEIIETAPIDYEWRIESSGKAKYRFCLGKMNRIIPRSDLIKIKIPDSTPEIITKYTSNDEQALLTKVRYNRLIDIFLGITAYSLQNHLRTTVKDIGQIEIDEIYVGINRNGTHFIIPVQAKSGSDQLSIIQTTQDIRYCQSKFPQLICRPVSAQFLDNNLIAMFELTLDDEGEIRVVCEKHYQLVSQEQISNKELENYRSRE